MLTDVHIVRLQFMCCGVLCSAATLISTYKNIRCHNSDACNINPLNAVLNPICHLLALLGAHHILHISRIRVRLYLF